jgi:RNA polymerase sigma-70 factor (ECF subfamily)
MRCVTASPRIEDATGCGITFLNNDGLVATKKSTIPVAHLRLIPQPPSRPSAEVDCLDSFQKELNYIHRTFLRLGTPASEVEDLVQELFLVLRRLWHEYDAERPLRPYLFGIAFRIASSHQRKYGREVKLGVVKVADPGPGPDDVLESNRARALVLEALEQVPLPRRAVLVLHELDHVAAADVASMLSIPLFTVYSRLRKGRRELDRAIRRILRRVDAG